ncbi:nitroreductase [Candidatus Pelagibacter sp.]|nr:nitroreductase [Candidatus Pelagibacter sp.]
MGVNSDFFLKRRSVIARKMSSKSINRKDLNLIISAGTRVPDHGALNPWKLIVMQGDTLKAVDKDIILSEFIKENPNMDKKFQNIQSKKLQRAGAVIAVLSKPLDHPSIPEWEMHLSSGAVCMNLLSCAQSMGYAAQWLTEWYAYNDKMLEYLGGIKNKDKIAGFIYISHKTEEPSERKRPDPYDVVTFL